MEFPEKLFVLMQGLREVPEEFAIVPAVDKETEETRYFLFLKHDVLQHGTNNISVVAELFATSEIAQRIVAKTTPVAGGGYTLDAKEIQ